eukprot:gene56169-76995_t
MVPVLPISSSTNAAAAFCRDRRIVLRMGRKIEDEESALSSSKPSRTKKGSSSRKKGGSATPIDPSPAPIKESAVASEEQPQPSAAAPSDPSAPSDPAVPSPSGEEESLL